MYARSAKCHHGAIHVEMKRSYRYEVLEEAPLAVVSPSVVEASGLLSSFLPRGAGTVLGRGRSIAKLTCLPSAVFGRRVIFFLSI
jgi:hypothetical protein